MLHVVEIFLGQHNGTVLQSGQADDAALTPLSAQLADQLWGLLPGLHRLVFDAGRVLLTLCIASTKDDGTGNVIKQLGQQRFEADRIRLNFAAVANLNLFHAAKAIARLCKRTTVLTTANNVAMACALKQCGFQVTTQRSELHASYNPNWATKASRPTVNPSRCVVVGAGLAGAAVASSLARRGWVVTVVDACAAPAGGASSLPAGLFAPHTSPDDSVLSRLSRAGVRATLHQARALLRHGIDWGHTGALQLSVGSAEPHKPINLPSAWADQHRAAAQDWCGPATAKTLAAAGLAAGGLLSGAALWHTQAGWVKPAALVRAWLEQPGIAWRGSIEVAKLTPGQNGWQVCDAAGTVLLEARLVVLAAGFASQALAISAGDAAPDLQAVRGQVTFGQQAESDRLAPFAINGHGSLITAVTAANGPIWVMGASYERDVGIADVKAHDHLANLARLGVLLPSAAQALADRFDPTRAQGWAGIRCTTPNRLPMVGRLAGSGARAGLWLCTGLGSRGLTFAALCGELLAAKLHGEPLPIDSRIALALEAYSRRKEDGG